MVTTSSDDDDLLIGTWNLWLHGMYLARPGERDRYSLQARIMSEDLPCDVWLVQELGSVEAFARLADRLGMHYAAGTPGEITETPVFDPGGQGFGVGVMWRPDTGITAVPGTRRSYTSDVFYHGVASVVLDLGDDVLLHVASGHATPWGAPQSIAEAKRWSSIMGRPNSGFPAGLSETVLPGVLGTDSNGISGDRTQRPDGTWAYHADDPLHGQPWHRDMIYQLASPLAFDSVTGTPVPVADRTPGDLLWYSGLHDSSAVLGLPCAPTAGYHPTDPLPDRDIDHLRVTQRIVDAHAVAEVTVLDTDRVRAASDHRPKRLRLIRSRLPRTSGQQIGLP